MIGERTISAELPSGSFVFDLEQQSKLWNGPREAWTHAVPGGIPGTKAALRASGRALRELCSSRPAEWFEAPFTYHNTRGDPLSHVPGPVLAHVFNHATHHRGQASAAITAGGAPAPVMDLLYFQKQGA